MNHVEYNVSSNLFSGTTSILEECNQGSLLKLSKLNSFGSTEHANGHDQGHLFVSASSFSFLFLFIFAFLFIQRLHYL